MSLPTTKSAQSSIRSFFQSATSKYSLPPSTPQSEQQEQPPPAPPPNNPTNPTTTHSSPPGATDPPKTTAPLPSLPSSLPAEASIRLVTEADIPALRRINALLLPVSYPDAFYASAVSSRLSRVITWSHPNNDNDQQQPKVIGSLVCRLQLEPADSNPNVQTLYIQSLCLLSPYRHHGLMRTALDNIFATAAQETDARSATAHVWTDNEDALKWYSDRGFEKQGKPIEEYYLKLRPNTAWLVSRDIGASVLPLMLKKDKNNESTTPPSVVKPSVTAAAVNLPPISGPPRSSANGPGASRPPMSSRTSTGQSFMDRRAETEWNDLPADMAPPMGGSTVPSAQSSRSSSQAPRKKKDRSYPAAAFGS